MQEFNVMQGEENRCLERCISRTENGTLGGGAPECLKEKSIYRVWLYGPKGTILNIMICEIIMGVEYLMHAIRDIRLQIAPAVPSYCISRQSKCQELR